VTVTTLPVTEYRPRYVFPYAQPEPRGRPAVAGWRASRAVCRSALSVVIDLLSGQGRMCSGQMTYGQPQRRDGTRRQPADRHVVPLA